MEYEYLGIHILSGPLHIRILLKVSFPVRTLTLNVKRYKIFAFLAQKSVCGSF